MVKGCFVSKTSFFCLTRLHTEPAVCLLLSFLFSLCFHKPWVLKELFGILSSMLLWWKSKVKNPQQNSYNFKAEEFTEQGIFQGNWLHVNVRSPVSLRATSLPPSFLVLHGQWHHCKVKKNTLILKPIFDQAPRPPSLRKIYSERVLLCSRIPE